MNKNLADFGTFVTNAGVYSAPARNFESIPIPGRTGNLIFENDKFDNTDHRYPIIIEDFDRNFPALKNYLLSAPGYQRLSDTFFPDEFYLATFKSFDTVKQKFLNSDMGSCVLVFERKPQRFLRGGEDTHVEILSSGAYEYTLKNPTNFNALPLIRVYGSGEFYITHEDESSDSITIQTSETYLDIDCELQEVLQTGGNLDITLEDGRFPYLAKGVNTIGKPAASNITKIEITPRWWKL